MNGADKVISFLSYFGCSDLFGIPGGVVLPLFYAAKSNGNMNLHLNFNEQASSFAALGYAQVSGKLGCAVATRGPGIANMITAIAEAWQESIPCVFITAHAALNDGNTRFLHAQELDFASAFSSFTKCSVHIETEQDLNSLFPSACSEAVSGRRGPVFADISAKLLRTELQDNSATSMFDLNQNFKVKNVAEFDTSQLLTEINAALRPVILIGDGLRHGLPVERLRGILNSIGIPAVSSRGAQDLLAGQPVYFGYVGSHGCRYANLILSKADLVIAVGNRLGFPENSQTFSQMYHTSRLIQIDLDSQELNRHKNWQGLRIKADAISVLTSLESARSRFQTNWNAWCCYCAEVKKILNESDCGDTVQKLSQLMRKFALLGAGTFVLDVGNNEFLCSRAYELAGDGLKKTVQLCSKSFGTLGVALAKAIGVYYATKKPVMCLIGDQGMQCNIQELQFLKISQIPVGVVVINNECSAMIMNAELRQKKEPLCVSKNNGYSAADFEKIAEAYGINDNPNTEKFDFRKPFIMTLKAGNDSLALWTMPKGTSMDQMYPSLEKNKTDDLRQAEKDFLDNKI